MTPLYVSCGNQRNITLFLLHLTSKSSFQLGNSEVVAPINFKHFPKVQAPEPIQTCIDYVSNYQIRLQFPSTVQL